MLGRKVQGKSMLDAHKSKTTATFNSSDLSSSLILFRTRPFRIAFGMGNTIEDDVNLAAGVMANQSKAKLCGFAISLDNRFDLGISGVCMGGFCQNNEGPLNGMSVSGVGSTTKSLKGVAASIVSTEVLGNVRGLACSIFYNVAGLEKCMFNHVKTENVCGNVKGVSFSGFVNYASESTGWAHGTFVNVITENLKGIASGLVVRVRGAARGLMLSCIGICNSFEGVMIGAINICNDKSQGIQIGLLNIRTDAPWYAKVVPGIAIRTNGKPGLKKEDEF